MNDKGLVQLNPDSTVKIDEFVFNNNAKTDKVEFSILKGTMRSITGKIGITNKKNYRNKTPVATIGIRGTDYTIRYCDNDCGDEYNGLYAQVYSGGIIIENDGGSLDVDPGEYAYVESVNAEPVFIETTNDLFNDDPTSLSQNTSSDADWGVWGGATQAMGMLASNEDLTGGNVFEPAGALATTGSVSYQTKTVVDQTLTGVSTSSSMNSADTYLNVNFDTQRADARVSYLVGAETYTATASGMDIVNGQFSEANASVTGLNANSGSLSGSFGGVNSSDGVPAEANVNFRINYDDGGMPPTQWSLQGILNFSNPN